MARQTNGSDSFLGNDAIAVVAPPFSMGCWFNLASAPATEGCVMSVANYGYSFDTQYHCINYVAASRKFKAISKNDSVSSFAVTSVGVLPTTNTWRHVLGVWGGATDRRIYIAGGGLGTDSTSISCNDMDQVSVGVRLTSDLTYDFCFGRYAEVAVWNTTLGDAEALQLALGVSPLLVAPGALAFYWPLIGNYEPEVELLNDEASHLYLMNSPSKVSHPRVYYPRGPKFSTWLPRPGTVRIRGGRILGKAHVR